MTDRDSDFFRERAKAAANARWAKERIFQRIEVIGAGIRAVNPKLTKEQAIAQAIRENPKIYAEYVAASSNQPSMTHAEMASAYEQEISELCQLADQPKLARFFIKQRTHPRDVVKFLLATKTGEPPKK